MREMRVQWKHANHHTITCMMRETVSVHLTFEQHENLSETRAFVSMFTKERSAPCGYLARVDGVITRRELMKNSGIGYHHNSNNKRQRRQNRKPTNSGNAATIGIFFSFASTTYYIMKPPLLCSQCSAQRI